MIFVDADACPVRAETVKVAERHGGRAWCESQVGMGSTFYFSLPVS